MLLAVGEHLLGRLDATTLRVASPLAGGVGSTRQEMCGALSGGILVIGGLYGRASLDEDETQALELARQYRERFLATFGDTQCAVLREGVEAPGGLDSCAALVERAAAVLLALLDDAAVPKQG